MKVVINSCFGGFSLSWQAVKAIARRKGRKCYFFRHDHKNKTWTRLKDTPSTKEMSWDVYAFDVPEVTEELVKSREFYQAHNLEPRPDDRTDPDLITVVQDLGKAASGRFAELTVVEIPDGIEWEINDYDGNETIHEKHRRWS